MRYFLYCLIFPDGKRYIGSTNNPRARNASHRWKGRDATMVVLCIGNRDYIEDLEAKAVIAFHTTDPELGYNVNIGRNHSLISRMRISKATKGRRPWNKGIPRTPKERAAIKAALAKSEAFDPNRIAGWNKGIPHSKTHRAKISAWGKGRPKSAKHRAAISLAMRRHSS